MLAMNRVAQTVTVATIGMGAILSAGSSPADGKPAVLRAILGEMGARKVVDKQGVLATAVKGGHALTVILLPRHAEQGSRGIGRQLAHAAIKVSAISRHKRFTSGTLSRGQRVIAFRGHARISNDLANNAFSGRHALTEAVDRVGLHRASEVKVGLFMKKHGAERIFVIVAPERSVNEKSAKIATETLDRIQASGFVYATLTQQISAVRGRFGGFDGMALIGPHLDLKHSNVAPPAAHRNQPK